jgi:AcrR family transcriptional regulator
MTVATATHRGKAYDTLINAVQRILRSISPDELQLQTITEHSQLSHQTIYNHFSSKRGLIEAAYSSLISDFDVLTWDYSMKHSPTQSLWFVVEKILSPEYVPLLRASHVGYEVRGVAVRQELIDHLKSYLDYFEERNISTIPVNTTEVATFNVDALAAATFNSKTITNGYITFVVSQMMGTLGVEGCLGSLAG